MITNREYYLLERAGILQNLTLDMGVRGGILEFG